MKKIVLIIVAVFCLIPIYINIQDYIRLTGVSFESIAKKKIVRVADSLNNIISETNILTESINNHIRKSGGKLDNKAIEQIINGHKHLFFFDRLYYITKQKEEYIINEIYLEHDSVYRIKSISKKINNEWLEKTFLSSKYNWQGPIFDSIQEKRMVCRLLPIISAKEAEPIYIIVLYNTSQLYHYLQDSGLNKFGVAYIVDSTSHFIAHPLDETRSFITLGRDFADNTLVELGHDIINQSFHNKEYIHTNTVTGLKCNEVIYPLPQMNAYLGVSVYNGESLESRYYQTVARQTLIRLFIYCLTFSIAIYLLISRHLNRNKHTEFQLFSSFIFFLLTMGIIYIYNRYPQNEQTVSTRTMQMDNVEAWKWDSLRTIDKENLNKLIAGYQKESLVLYNEQAKIIPTGAYIYDIQFSGSHEIKVSGIVWQKFLKTDLNYPPALTGKYQDDNYKNKGILFPGSRITDLTIQDTLDIILDDHPATLYRWNFDMDIGQKMSYSLYPFGKSEVSIPFWSMDLDDNTLLIPDLDSYKQVYPTNMPGMNPHFTIKGWNLLSSYFSYSYDSYLCSFGNMDIHGINNFPELVFNVSISRKFLDILISKIIPLLVILTLLFTLIFIRKKEDGFNNVIGCSGLFFVLVLDHINLREAVLSEGIMYIEFCYFISYIILLLVTITSFEVDTVNKQSGYTKTLDIVLRNYFWSIILGAMAIVSVFYFY